MNPYRVYDKMDCDTRYAIDDESYVGFDAWEQTWDAEQIDVGTPIMRKQRGLDMSDFVAEVIAKMESLSDEDFADFIVPDFLS